jgi:tetratricopeptide (TPR) repeat protein
MHAELAYIFRHALLRDAAYGLQPPRERGVLHGLALEILQAVLTPEEVPALALELAEHARLAMHDTLPEERRRALLTAEHGYLIQAAEYLKTHWQSSDEVRVRDLLAVHPCADAREQRRHLYTAGERLEQIGDLREAEQRAREMLERARREGDSEDETRALLMLHHLLPELGRAAELEHTAAQLAQRVTGLSAETRIYALTLQEHEAYRTGRYDDALRINQQAQEIAEAAGRSDWLATLLASQASNHARLGDVARALAASLRSVELAECSGDKHVRAQMLNHRGIACIESGDLAGAQQAYSEALRQANAIGSHGLAQTIAVNLGNLQLYFLGGLRSAEQAYRNVVQHALEQGAMRDAATASNRLGAVLAYRDRTDEAAAVLVNGIRCARLGNDVGAEAAGHMLLSSCRVLDAHERIQELATALRMARGIKGKRLEGEAWMRAAELLSEQGCLSAALEAATQAERILPGAPGGTPFLPHVAAARFTAQLLLGDTAGARASVDAALAGLSAKVPQHRVSKGYAAQVALRVLEDAGPLGLRRTTAALGEEIARLGAEADQMLAHTEYGRHGRTRAALEYMQQVGTLLSGGPPCPLLFGMTLEWLTPQQMQAALERMAAQDPALLETLRRENPRLAQELEQRAEPTLLDWDTGLAQVPQLAELLE